MRRTTNQIAPRDVYYSVDAPKFCSNMVVWMSQRNCESVVDNGSGNVFKSVVQPGHQEDRVLITVLAWDKIKTNSIKSNVNTVKVVGSVAVEIKPKTGLLSQMPVRNYTFSIGNNNTVTFTGRGFVVDDVSGAICRDLTAAAASAANQYGSWLKSNNITFKSGAKPYLQPTMVEADWTFNSSFAHVPALSGWPQMARLEFNTLSCFPRATLHACSMLGIVPEGIGTILGEYERSGANDVNVDRVLTVLAVCTLTAFAGTYPVKPECVDDRTLGALKLGKNRDCDDMAITVVSVFNKLQRDADAGCTPTFEATPEGMLALLVHNFMLFKYKTAAAIVCRADPTVAVGGKTSNRSAFMCGHVYAILSTAKVQANGHCDNLVGGATVVEATRISSPYPEPLNSDTFHLDGKPIFTRRAYCLGESDVQTIKPFMAVQYPQNIAAYTAANTYALAYKQGDRHEVGVSGVDMFANTAGVSALCIPTRPQDRYVHDDLAHKVNLSTIDSAILQHSWWAKLGFAKPPVHIAKVASPHWTHFIGDICHASSQSITSLFTYGAYVVVDNNNCIVECTTAAT